MNIADRPRFYREACRVLRPGGVLALANACAGEAGEPYFPAPWATTPATSFLASPEEMRADIAAAGFVVFADKTAAMLPAQIRYREQLERDGLPLLSPAVIMGDRLREMQINSARSTEDGRLRYVEALVRRKPS
jgi:SAM-dependent methyltransferase